MYLVHPFFDIWKEVTNRKFFVRCGYGLDLRYTGFQLRRTLNRAVGTNCSTDNRTAPYNSWKYIFRAAPLRRKTALHRTLSFWKSENRTAPHRGTIRSPPKKKRRTEPHRVISKIGKKKHRGAVLHRQKPWYYYNSHPVLRSQARTFFCVYFVVF